MIALLHALPAGVLPIDPDGDDVTMTSRGAIVRIQRADWDGYAEVVSIAADHVVVVVTECGPGCEQAIVSLHAAEDGKWLPRTEALRVEDAELAATYALVSGARYEEDVVPAMVEAKDDGRLVVVTQAHLGPEPAELGVLVWREGRLAFEPVTS